MNSTATGSKCLFTLGGIGQGEDRVEKRGIKNSHALFRFISISCLAVKIQTWRHYFLKTLHIYMLYVTFATSNYIL